MLQQRENLIYHLLNAYDRFDYIFVYRERERELISRKKKRKFLPAYIPVKNNPIVLTVQIFSINGVKLSLLLVIVSQ